MYAQNMSIVIDNVTLETVKTLFIINFFSSL